MAALDRGDLMHSDTETSFYGFRQSGQGLRGPKGVQRGFEGFPRDQWGADGGPEGESASKDAPGRGDSSGDGEIDLENSRQNRQTTLSICLMILYIYIYLFIFA